MPLTNGQAQWTSTPSPAKRPSPPIDRPDRVQPDRNRPARPSLQLERARQRGRQWADGNYTLTSRQRRERQSVAILTTVTGIVTRSTSPNPPLMSIGGQNYTLNQILSVVRLLDVGGVGAASAASATVTNLFRCVPLARSDRRPFDPATALPGNFLICKPA
jgi:hypothetical protein